MLVLRRRMFHLQLTQRFARPARPSDVSVRAPDRFRLRALLCGLLLALVAPAWVASAQESVERASAPRRALRLNAGETA